jgi:hypothetical protein
VVPQQWKECITVPIYKKGEKNQCRNYKGMSMLPTTYKILSNILVSRLTPYVNEITGDRCNRPILIRYSAFVRYWRKKCSSGF